MRKSQIRRSQYRDASLGFAPIQHSAFLIPHLQQSFKITFQDGHRLLHHGVGQGHEALCQDGDILFVLQLLKSRIDLVDKFFLSVHHGVPSGVGDIELLGNVMLKLLAHILQKHKVECAFLHAWGIDALHQLGQLHAFEIKQETLIGLHLQRHDDFEGLHLQFIFTAVAQFSILHLCQTKQYHQCRNHQQKAGGHDGDDNPGVHFSFEFCGKGRDYLGNGQRSCI